MFITLKCFYEILHTFGAIPDMSGQKSGHVRTKSPDIRQKSGHVRTQSEIVRKTTPQGYPHNYDQHKIK